MADVPRFQWSVAESGYRWVRGKPVRAKVGRAWVPLPTSTVTEDVRAALGLGSPEGQGTQLNWYLTARIPRGSEVSAQTITEPLKDQPRLFDEFAHASPTRQGILAFANRHGLLGGEQQLVRPGHTRSSQKVLLGEPLSSWVAAISYMSFVCDFQQRLDRKEVPTHPTMHPFPSLQADGGPLEQSIQSLDAEDFGSSVDLPPNPTTLDTTRAAIQMVANDRLSKGVTARLVWHDEWRQYTLRLVPNDLLGAMWLQFTEAIAKNRDYAKCESCGRWMEISTQQSGATARRRFCSDRCRLQSHRKQRRAVLALAEAGISIPEIARRTGKEARQVRTWVKQVQRRR